MFLKFISDNKTIQCRVSQKSMRHVLTPTAGCCAHECVKAVTHKKLASRTFLTRRAQNKDDSRCALGSWYCCRVRLMSHGDNSWPNENTFPHTFIVFKPGIQLQLVISLTTTNHGLYHQPWQGNALIRC